MFFRMFDKADLYPIIIKWQENCCSVFDFTPLEKATDFSRWLSPYKANGGLKPPLAQTVREQSSLTGFTCDIVTFDFVANVTGF